LTAGACLARGESSLAACVFFVYPAQAIAQSHGAPEKQKASARAKTLKSRRREYKRLRPPIDGERGATHATGAEHSIVERLHHCPSLESYEFVDRLNARNPVASLSLEDSYRS
jgi:hypothetical protein